jgi:NAD(P)-dependent dehydrogenase (short-subunit alcohol dehydrogenase family)
MRIQGAVALVTGANRGLGREFARALLDRGARTVYAGARDPRRVTDGEVVPVALDITDPSSVAAVAERCRDVTLLVNNAGIARTASLLGAPSLDDARAEMETNYFGTLAMCRAFAPILGANSGGAIVNVLSIASFRPITFLGSYAASKAAEWSMTNAVRLELAEQGTLVVGVHAGFIDTDMAAGIDALKSTPEEVVAQVLDAVEAGRVEVLADERTRAAKAALSSGPEVAAAPSPALRTR